MIDPNATDARLWFRPRDIAEMTSLSEAEIYKAIYRGDLKAKKYRSRAWLISREDFMKWQAENFIAA